MAHLILFASAILVPVIILTVLRIDASLVFLSLCLGEVLVQYVAGDTISLVTTFYSHTSLLSDNTLKIIILFLPVVLTAIVMIHSVKKSKLLFNIFPALGAGLLGVLLVEPLLSAGLRGSLDASSLWKHFTQAQTLVILVSAVVSLAFLWVSRRGSKSGDGKHH